MKIVIPVREDRGLDSTVFHHFGSAPVWLVVDTSTGALSSIPRAGAREGNYGCGSVEQLVSLGIDAVVTGGIGPRALARLEAADILVFEGPEGTVRDALEALRTRGLPQWDAERECSRDHGAGCGGADRGCTA
ncbi:MAG: NifB/NifX family molybdenum-iron cluster-binding protein [Acidobacteriota bacterium]